MRRTLAVLAIAGLAAAVAGSAATVTLNADTIQAGSSDVSCDTDGINTNWGLETDDNSVRSIKFVGIDAACVGAELFVEIRDAANGLIFKSSQDVLVPDALSFPLPKKGTPAAYPTPESINSVKVWIEG
jgi:hypothetical protein